MTPAFDPTVDTYTVAVQLGVTSVTITPTANQSGATITVEGEDVNSGAASDTLSVAIGGSLVVDIVVTAPDGITTGAYTVTVSRATAGGAARTAALTGSVTEANLFAGAAVVTMTLTNTEFETGVAPTDFGISDTVDGTISIAGVTLADGSTTEATIMLAHSGGDITAGDLMLELLDSGHTGSGTLAAGSVMIRVSDGDYVCDRTAAVRDAITTASANDDCTNINDLATITALDLSNQGINRLQDGDLDGLAALATLALAGNPFTAGGLPAGIFDDVVDTLGDVGTAFTVDNAVRQAHFICSRADGGAIVAATAGVTDCLRITEAQLTAFPAIDASLSALTLSAGDLMPSFDPAITAYNVGVDVGSVTVTPTANQSGATITVNGAPVVSGSASVAVPLTANTPVPITIQVTATDTSTSRDYVVMVTRGGATAVLVGGFGERGLFSTDVSTRQTGVGLVRTEFVPAADLGPDDFMVTDTIDGTLSVASITRSNATNVTLTMEYTGDDITTNGVFFITVLASAHTGSGDLITNTQAITASTGVNVCGRTAQVRDSIVNQSTASECTSITDLDTFISFTRTLNRRNISSLQSGDFAGMSSFAGVLLQDNQLTTLPADIFADLPALQTVNLSNNNIETLDANTFDGLDTLLSLTMTGNQLAALDADIFDGLDALTNLGLVGNPFTADTGLPAGIFDDVLNTLGPVAATGVVGLAVDDVGRAAHFVCSLPVADLIVAATTDVDSCLRITTAQLAAFPMVDTSLSALTISSGDMLMPAFNPATTTYTVGVLNSATSITVTPTANQSGATITITVGGVSTSGAIALMEGTPVDIVIVVTAPDGTTMETVTVTATREGLAAVLAGTVTEANLFAATAPTVTVTLTGADYVEAGELMPDDFTVTDTLTDGTVSITEVARTSNRIATLTLGYDDIDITANGRLAVTVLETAHSDSGDLDAGMIDITASPGTNVCGRTAPIRDQIVSRSAASECTSIADLATIGLIGLANQNIPALRSGDFADMSGLALLNLTNNRIATIDPGTFADLSMLENLFLGGTTGGGNRNRLTALNAELFDDLSALTVLSLANNDLTALPADIFVGLEALGDLNLSGNPFTPGTGLPAGIFDDVINTLVRVGSNDLEVDDTVRAAHFVCSRPDFAAIEAANGDTDCLLISSAQFDAFLAADATLSALTISDGVLSPPFDLATVAYTVAVQNSVESVTLTPTASQSGATITVEGTVVASGDTSAAIDVDEGMTTAISIAVNSPDTSSTVTYTINVSRPAMGGATAVLAGTLTEANLFARAATATVTLMGTEYVAGFVGGRFHAEC